MKPQELVKLYHAVLEKQTERKWFWSRKRTFSSALKALGHSPEEILAEATATLLSEGDRMTPEEIDAAFSLTCQPSENTQSIDLLHHLLALQNHYMHEEVATGLQIEADPRSVEPLESAISNGLEDDRFNHLKPFERKCFFALSEIGTSEAWTAIDRFANSEDAEIREFAKEQLLRHGRIDAPNKPQTGRAEQAEDAKPDNAPS
ncbi:MAG: hypothetical protein MI807_12625 [Verrucomicrobiales bacterium]|nr:hypothetical protein [Verrucomicrobiales bacterium]